MDARPWARPQWVRWSMAAAEFVTAAVRSTASSELTAFHALPAPRESMACALDIPGCVDRRGQVDGRSSTRWRPQQLLMRA
mmetsp:Transcript_32756/g.97668  ORF Transcript_32756/g.97668 Transcript_32756/m.97668 type:complete len:81 (-) Transcript_32756:840-1082(-)|eukprot:198960-Chlamydomonas_euryale.AAC.1